MKLKQFKEYDSFGVWIATIDDMIDWHGSKLWLNVITGNRFLWSYVIKGWPTSQQILCRISIAFHVSIEIIKKDFPFIISDSSRSLSFFFSFEKKGYSTSFCHNHVQDSQFCLYNIYTQILPICHSTFKSKVWLRWV